MRWLERLAIFGMLAVVAALSVWLEFGDEEDAPAARQQDRPEHPDYYIEKFVTRGMDEAGQLRYSLEAERLVHYPVENIALLDRPHMIQYRAGRAPTHTYSESGCISPNGDEVLLRGNVRVLRGKAGADTGGVATSDRMRITLKKGTFKKKAGAGKCT